MGKQHTTKKEIYARFGKENVYCINTIENGHFLLGTPDYYTTRIEGFAANIWVVSHNFVVVEGYAPFGTKLDAQKVNKIWNKAYKVHKNNWCWARKQAQKNKYIRELYALAKGEK
jgi:hypothetical protein